MNATETPTAEAPILVLDSATLALSELTSEDRTRPALHRLYFHGNGEPPRVYATDGSLGVAFDLPAQSDKAGVAFDIAASDAKALAKAAGKNPVTVDTEARVASSGVATMALPEGNTFDVPGCLRPLFSPSDPVAASTTLSVPLLHALLTTAKKLGLESLRVDLRADPHAPVLFSGMAKGKGQDPRKFDAVLMPMRVS